MDANVREFMSLAVLQIVGPVWVREMIKRRPREARLGLVVEFARGPHAAGSDEVLG